MAKKNILLRSKKNKALALIKEKKLEEARALLLQLTRADRMYPEIWMALGAVYGWLGNFIESEKCCRKAVELRPGHVESQYNLGVALRDQGKFEEAVDVFRQVIVIEPGYELAYDSLADALVKINRLDDAIQVFREIVQCWPAKVEAYGSLATILQMSGKAEEAIRVAKQAIELNSKFHAAYDVIGNACIAMGEYEDGNKWQRKGLEIFPHDSRRHSNLLLSLNYLPHPDRDQVFREHCEWGKKHSIASKDLRGFRNLRDADKTLKVGYVSPDLREHSVAYFLEPILRASSGGDLEIFCYSDMPRPDKVTLRLKGLSDHWCDSHGLTDQQLSNQILNDEIDILVDLSGHTANHRLRLFSMRPAPIQMTYLGYPNTTGVEEIQYRITDTLVDPVGEDKYYTEELLRLPGCFLCYQAEENCPELSPLPEGPIVFGSFNNLAKVNDNVIELWARTVLSVEDGRLLMKNPSLSDPDVRSRYLEKLLAHGLSGDRIELIGHTPTRRAHLELYSRMHIALDTFPYNGTTTTCEALWMGVPVITLAGHYHAGRVGASLLNAAGYPTLVAGSEADFIRIAGDLSVDKPQLAELRGGMRGRVLASRLCDADIFVSELAAAYRRVWYRWCEESAN